MSRPVTALDPRFSDPAAEPVSWDRTEEVLRDAQMFWISTVRADGRPHVSPLVAVWLDGVLYFSTGAAEQKGVNLSANPQVALTTGSSFWNAGLDVVVEGRAVRVTDDATLRRLAEAWTTKWDGRWRFEARDGAFHHDGGGEALVFAVAPAKVLAFGKEPFTHTRHVFV
ncbi:MAG TPA: pyridoxamine 5'-phosphate oxidase family protein [Streptosporangiaceae bacterium]